MLPQNQHPNNCSIVVALLGAPNVGKSSLVNRFLGFELSAVTHKPQTTRNRFNCVLVENHVEIIFTDTPGLHKSNKEMNKRMNQQAIEGGKDSELNLLLVDITSNWDQQIIDVLAHFKQLWIVFTKCDLLKDLDQTVKKIDSDFLEMRKKYPTLERYFITSSVKGEGIEKLKKDICKQARSGPHLYINGGISDKNQRFFAREYIREQAFNLLSEELPYELAVEINDYKDFDERGIRQEDGIKAKIDATILVNKQSQRAIVVGRKGQMIKEIGMRARAKIEELVKGQVFLHLHVKVCPKWFSNNSILERLELPRAFNSKRVWRKR